MFLDLSRSYLTWTNAEPIRYETARKNIAPDSAAFLANPNPSFSIARAKRRSVTTRDVMAGVAAYGAQDATWHLPNVLLPPGVTPKRADVIVDTRGDRWTVLEAALESYGSRWRLPCRNLILAEDLRDTVTIERCTISFDGAGVKIKAWPTRTGPTDTSPVGGKILYQLPAKVQTMSVELADERGIRGAKGTVAVVVGRQVIVDPEQDRVKLSDGSYLDLLGYHEPDRDDVLPTLDCEKRP